MCVSTGDDFKFLCWYVLLLLQLSVKLYRDQTFQILASFSKDYTLSEASTKKIRNEEEISKTIFYVHLSFTERKIIFKATRHGPGING